MLCQQVLWGTAGRCEDDLHCLSCDSGIPRPPAMEQMELASPLASHASDVAWACAEPRTGLELPITSRAAHSATFHCFKQPALKRGRALPILWNPTDSVYPAGLYGTPGACYPVPRPEASASSETRPPGVPCACTDLRRTAYQTVSFLSKSESGQEKVWNCCKAKILEWCVVASSLSFSPA